MFELMFRDEEQVDLKRYIRAFVSVRLPSIARVHHVVCRICVYRATQRSPRFPAAQ